MERCEPAQENECDEEEPRTESSTLGMSFGQVQSSPVFTAKFCAGCSTLICSFCMHHFCVSSLQCAID